MEPILTLIHLLGQITYFVCIMFLTAGIAVVRIPAGAAEEFKFIHTVNCLC